ncbi:MAG: hypothetical protein PF447_14795 [Spirochaetaceae bacterium]|jgi:hypothetical protein|nr:hypothetical protein [Spirochaetaceae bacterium]
MKKSLVLFLFLITLLLHSQERKVFGETVYDPFFSLTLIDSQGSEYRLNAAAFFNLEEQRKYFFWVRRGTEMGIITYALELDRVARIDFTGPYGSPNENYTPASLTLTDGQVFDVYLGTAGYLGGYDEDFGSYGRVFLNYNQVKSIEFHHQGRYSRCPYCGTVYFDKDRTECPFDGFELVTAEGDETGEDLGDLEGIEGQDGQDFEGIEGQDGQD